ncbi:extracellular matrix protein A-like [Rhinatrema bivittatum]|uniref:extracellular matrix protein A-like n=1 Tax=Rhinatrema bivittatum TaxID=194408 RepID=UPI00112AFAB6|nr:extracellular matrix protein A-like [Rhinatrema bivittatum]
MDQLFTLSDKRARRPSMKLVGQTWEVDCKRYTCESQKLIIESQCAAPAPIQCKPGEVMVTKPDDTDPCCQQYVCECNITQCTAVTKTCDPGYVMVETTSEDSCCPNVTCIQTACIANGQMHQPGDTWTANCQMYTCSNQSMVAVPSTCKTPSNTCLKEGQVSRTQKDPNNTCCNETVCECDVSTCNQTSVICDVGLQPNETIPKGECCPVFSCVRKDVCVSNGIEYPVGQTWDVGCNRYTCESQELIIEPQCAPPPPIQCNKTGEVMVTKPDDTDPCCQQNVCECNYTTCSTFTKTCDPGYNRVITTPEDSCCPNVTCVLVDFSCLVNGIEHKPVDVWTQGCLDYECNINRSMTIQPQPCDSEPAIDCTEEEVLVFKPKPSDPCCSMPVCVPVCVSSGIPHQPGSTWQEECTDYTCDSVTLMISGAPHFCNAPANVTCAEDEILITQTVASDLCCTEGTCVRSTTPGPTTLAPTAVSGTTKSEGSATTRVTISASTTTLGPSTAAPTAVSGTTTSASTAVSGTTPSAGSAPTRVTISAPTAVSGTTTSAGSAPTRVTISAPTAVTGTTTSGSTTPGATTTGPTGVCVVDEVSYQLGSLIQKNPCEVCSCTNEMDPETMNNAVSCIVTDCFPNCSLGFQYFPKDGQCCGECKQTDCVVPLESGAVTIKPGEIYNVTGDYCTYYECIYINGSFITEEVHTSCFYLDSSMCALGFQYFQMDGQCCGECKQTDCVVLLESEAITIKPGEIYNVTGDYCTYYECIYTNDSFITEEVHTSCFYLDSAMCALGFQYFKMDGQCCGECKQTDCVVLLESEAITIKPGEIYNVPGDNCTYYECIYTNDSFITEEVHTSCFHLDSVMCVLGFQYFKMDGQCCGECKQTDCVVLLESEAITIKPGVIYNVPGDNCTHYECIYINGSFITEEVHTSCFHLDSSTCAPGTLTTSPDGCCQTCELMPESCKIKTENITLTVDECTSAEEVTVNSCEGACNSFSLFSTASVMPTNCSCCHSERSSIKSVELYCKNDTTVNFSYTYIEACGCDEQPCEAWQP